MTADWGKEETMNIASLEKGFATIPLQHELRQNVNWFAKSWRQFCSLPEETKCGFKNGHEKGVGYFCSGANNDKAEGLSVTKNDIVLINKWYRDTESHAAREFAYCLSILMKNATPLVISVAGQVERHYGLPEFGRQVATSRDRWRYICLKKRAAVGETFVQHKDLDFRLFESAEKCEYLDDDHTWQPRAAADGNGAVLLSCTNMRLHTTGRIRSPWHRILPAGTGIEERHTLSILIPCR